MAEQQDEERPTTADDDDESTIATAASLPELPFHKLIVGGTLSLGLLLLFGAGLIMTLSLLEYSDAKGAEASDFESAGAEACRILNTSTYERVQKDLNSLNRLCIEEWTYHVQLLNETTSFISNTLSFTACKAGCKDCPEFKFQGENYYAGVESNLRGQQIDNATFVECFQPTIPLDQLSNFYQCQETTCYLLKDPRIRLKEKTESYEFGMLGAYVGIGAGVALLMCSFWCMWKNRQAMNKLYST